MDFIGESSLHSYAGQFWRSESDRDSVHNRIAFRLLREGADPVRLLRQVHPCKLPCDGQPDCHIQIMRLARNEVEALTIHQYKVNGFWMHEHGFRPNTNLQELASYLVRSGYFAGQDPFHEDPQRRYYNEWRQLGSLANVMASAMPLIEQTSFGPYEIRDGWERLLAYVSLVQEGFKYYPVNCFVACCGK